MKRTKQKNNSKVNSSYLNRLRLNKFTYKRIPIYASNRHGADTVRAYQRGKLIDEFVEIL